MSFSTHFALSNLDAGVAGAVCGLSVLVAVKMEAVVEVVAVDLGDVPSVAVIGEEDGADEAVNVAAAPIGFVGAEGEEKKEVIEALDFGFFAVLVAMSAALRLRGVAMTVSALQKLRNKQKHMAERRIPGALNLAWLTRILFVQVRTRLIRVSLDAVVQGFPKRGRLRLSCSRAYTCINMQPIRIRYSSLHDNCRLHALQFSHIESTERVRNERHYTLETGFP